MRIICFITSLLLLSVGCVHAQTGTLKGRVINANSGKPIEGFSIAILSLNKEQKTDSLGRYKLAALPADTYAVRFKRSGYKTHAINNVVVIGGKVTTRNISITPKRKPETRKNFFRNKDAIQSQTSRRPGKQAGNEPVVRQDFNREAYDRIEANPFKRPVEKPLSTFSIDVDRASYANTRRFLNQGELPQKDAVRIEELINYFNYDYPAPSGQHPFSVNIEAAACPWQKEHQLLHIGLQGRKIPKTDIPPSNLVFLIDVSGSMNSPKKLPLVKESLQLLTKQLRARDQLTIVVYAGSSGMVLPPTPGDQKAEISQAINKLEAGGGTAGSKGIKLAYQKAGESFIENGNNRVILATDGDFNIGVTSDGALTRLIERKREEEVYLSALGFGMGNYQGSKMEKLSNNGNGNYSYIDSRLEAKKSLVTEFGGTMNTIAKDVKVQVEFNPAKVKAYRLIGYVNRQLDKTAFRNDSIDAGELGAGHSVTALYELVPQSTSLKQKPSRVPDLKYQEKQIREAAYESSELGNLRLRYKEPDEEESQLIEQPIQQQVKAEPSANFHWSAAVAMFGMQLRQSPYKGSTDYKLLRESAERGMGTDEQGYRQDFMKMVDKAQKLQQGQY
jgi:Ca-activated chloride channel family protein